MQDGVQRYSCNDCNLRFRSSRRQKVSLQKQLWGEYVFNKQTYRELGEKYNLDKRTVRNHLDEYQPTNKKHNPRQVHVVVDATWWGQRKEKTSWCSYVARDPSHKENLWWGFDDNENTNTYRQCRDDLEALGYKIVSVTGDGFSGIKQAFSGIPYQMCLVHMERIVVRGTTRTPQTEAGVVLLAMVKSLFYIGKDRFEIRLRKYFQMYDDFLNERTIHPESGTWSYAHEDLRRAAYSLNAMTPDLFTHKRHSGINRTTNSIEGHFSHVEDIMGVHRGLSRSHKTKVLKTIYHASTIAPSKKKLKEIL